MLAAVRRGLVMTVRGWGWSGRRLVRARDRVIFFFFWLHWNSGQHHLVSRGVFGLYYGMIDYISGTKYRINLKFDTVMDINKSYYHKKFQVNTYIDS